MLYIQVVSTYPISSESAINLNGVVLDYYPGMVVDLAPLETGKGGTTILRFAVEAIDDRAALYLRYDVQQRYEIVALDIYCDRCMMQTSVIADMKEHHCTPGRLCTECGQPFMHYLPEVRKCLACTLTLKGVLH